MESVQVGDERIWFLLCRFPESYNSFSSEAELVAWTCAGTKMCWSLVCAVRTGPVIRPNDAVDELTGAWCCRCCGCWAYLEAIWTYTVERIVFRKSEVDLGSLVLNDFDVPVAQPSSVDKMKACLWQFWSVGVLKSRQYAGHAVVGSHFISAGSCLGTLLFSFHIWNRVALM